MKITIEQPSLPSNLAQPSPVVDPLAWDLDQLMEVEGEKRPVFPWQELYPNLSRKPMRMSFSSFNLFNSCERKFNLSKNRDMSSWEIVQDTNRNNVHLDYGTALGVGFQSLILSQDLEASIWGALRSYNFADETKAKNSLSIVTALQAFHALDIGDEWEIVYYKGKPAAELSFKLVLDPETGDYYCGFIDVVIRHRVSKVAVIVEVKTTGSKQEDLKPMFQNSAQGIGYSIILDAIEQEAGFDASWTVLYIVAQFKGPNIIPKINLLPFNKQAKHRFEWLLDMKLDYQRLLELEKLDYWPKRGNNCFNYFRPCPYFGICDLESIAETTEARIAKEEDWDFVFNLEDLIAKEMNRDAA